MRPFWGWVVAAIKEEVHRHLGDERAYRDAVGLATLAFEVTNVRVQSIGRSEYLFAYLRAADDIRQRFGLSREILMTVGAYTEFQGRLLQAHLDELDENRARLDPSFSIVASPDRRVRGRVEQFLSQNRDALPIAGLHVGAAWQPDRHELLEELKSQFFARDLFASDAPLESDRLFYGRQSIVTLLLDRAKQGQNTGLFGLRRMGKTSVLRAVARRGEAASISRSVYIDASDPDIYLPSWPEALQGIASRVAGELASKSLWKQLQFSREERWTERTASAYFRELVEKLVGHADYDGFVLQLDEIESLSPVVSPASHWSSLDGLNLWRTLRATHQALGGRFTFIVAGVNPSLLERPHIGEHDNPLFSTVGFEYLPPFDLPDAAEMLRGIGRLMGLPASDEYVSDLHSLVGGHPYLMRQISSLLARQVDLSESGLTAEALRGGLAVVTRRVQRNVRQILSVLGKWYPDEFETVARYVAGDFEQSELLPYADHLSGYGLVGWTNDGEPTIRSEVVRLGLLEQAEDFGVIASPDREEGNDRAASTASGDQDWEEVVAEVSVRRNKLERQVRRIVSQGLLFAYGAKAASKVFAALGSKRSEALGGLTLDEVMSRLYWNEYPKILQAEYVHFQARFARDSSDVVAWMKVVNDFRIDAHASDFDEDQLAHVRYCFSRLEHLFEVG